MNDVLGLPSKHVTCTLVNVLSDKAALFSSVPNDLQSVKSRADAAAIFD